VDLCGLPRFDPRAKRHSAARGVDPGAIALGDLGSVPEAFGVDAPAELAVVHLAVGPVVAHEVRVAAPLQPPFRDRSHANVSVVRALGARSGRSL